MATGGGSTSVELTWALTEVETCGASFVELPSRGADEPVWGDYGVPFDEYLGVSAYSNGIGVRSACYQCTEVVHRFVRHAYGIPTYYCGPQPMGNARFVVRNLGRTFGNTVGSTARLGRYKVRLQASFNGQSRCRPTVGSIVSVETSGRVRACRWDTGTGGGCDRWTKARAYDRSLGAGHIGVIRSLESVTDDLLQGEIFAQHGKMYSGRPKYRDARIAVGRIRFKRRRDGTWFGWWYTPTPGGGIRSRARPVIGWASPRIVGRDATPGDWKAFDTQTPCAATDPDSSWSQTCTRIRAGFERRSER